VLSWAVVNGGRRTASEAVWCEVRDALLGAEVDPARLLADALAEAGLPGAVGLLTSRGLEHHVVVHRRAEGAWARAVATVGLGNALRAGDPPSPSPRRLGTINVLCQLSMPLSENALVEALALAAEARTVAVLEARVASQVSGAAATGTGTDCLVVAAPQGTERLAYAGKHTVAGHLVGAVVNQAVRRGVDAWLEENGGRGSARAASMADAPAH
jgi:adenosylcobinamide amidohydrolase